MDNKTASTIDLQSPFTPDMVQQLVLAKYCGVSPLDIEKRFWSTQTNKKDEEIARIVQIAQEKYHRQRPDDPIVVQYKRDTQERNQVHYFLFYQREYNDALYWELIYTIFLPKKQEIEQRIKGILEEKWKRKGCCAIQFGDLVFFDQKEVNNHSVLNSHFARRLEGAYNAGEGNPLECAVTVSVDDCIAEIKLKPFSELPPHKFMEVLHNYMRKEKYVEEGDCKKQKKDPDITALVRRVIKSTNLDKERREARKTTYGNLLVDIIGNMSDRVHEVYADISLANKEGGDDNNLTLMEEQTRQVIQYRIAHGWFHVTPGKRQEMDAHFAYLKKKIPIRATLLSCKYGLEDGKQRTIGEIARDLSMTRYAVTTKLCPVEREFNDPVFEMIRRGAEDSDISLYRACM